MPAIEPIMSERAAAERRAAFELLRDACAECTGVVAPEWQSCAQCGARRSTACPSCGVPLPPYGSARCGRCGFVLRDITPA